MPRDQAINSDLYLQAFKTLQKRFRNVGRHRNIAEILLQHNNAWPHTSFKTQEAITKLGFTVLPHPPCSPNLAASDLQLFGTLKDVIRRKRVRSTDEVIEEVGKWLWAQDSNLYKKEREGPFSGWHKAIEVVGCYTETCNTFICSSCEYVTRITQ
jgi:hypothetical protein